MSGVVSRPAGTDGGPANAREFMVSGQRPWTTAACYLAGASLRKFGAAIWVPVLLYWVSPADFTRYGLMLSLVSLLVPLFTLALPFAPMRLAFDYASAGDKNSLYKEVIRTSFWMSLFAVGLSLGIVSLLYPNDPLSRGAWSLKVCIASQVMAVILGECAFSILRIQAKAKRFLFTALVYALLPFFIALPFLSRQDLDPLFVISAAMAFGMLAASGIAIGPQFKAIFHAIPSKTIRHSAIVFSLPMTFHLVGLWSINASGRWIGTASQSLDDLASYQLLSAVASLLMGIPVALLEAKLPHYNAAFGRGDASTGVAILRRVMLGCASLMIVIYGAAAIGLSMGQESIPEAYFPAGWSLTGFCIFNVAHCFYLIGINTLSGLKQTSRLALSTLVSGTLTILVSYFAAIQFGEIGLVAGMVAGMLLQAIVTNALAAASMRVYRRKVAA